MMDTMWTQQSFSFKKNMASISRALIRLNTIREPSRICVVVTALTISYFLNQKLWVINLTDSQGLGMQKQIQGTDPNFRCEQAAKEFGIFLGCPGPSLSHY